MNSFLNAIFILFVAVCSVVVSAETEKPIERQMGDNEPVLSQMGSAPKKSVCDGNLSDMQPLTHYQAPVKKPHPKQFTSPVSTRQMGDNYDLQTSEDYHPGQMQ